MEILLGIICTTIGVLIGLFISVYKTIKLSKENAAKEQKISDLNETIEKQNKLHDTLKIEFENIASKVLDEKNSKISQMNKQALENVVMPFKEKIDEFKDKVENFHLDQTKQRAVLKNELERLMDLNKQVSQEANNLADALKGESKIQGIWGELSLERIFESAGMIKNVHYSSQESFNTQEGRKIPDYIVHLPEDKHMIIDSKTSLTAYEKYYNCQTENEKTQALKEHITSIKKHIDELAEKNYQDLPAVNQPDYVLMFVPIDSAVNIALTQEPQIQEYAFKKNVIIVTPSTLLAAMKTVGYMWRQENQKKNVMEIAKQGGLLYDRFVDFVEILNESDASIDKAKSKITQAIKKLSNPDRQGDSLIGRAQKLKELGAPAKKELPKNLIEK